MGKPSARNGALPRSEFIGSREQTRGSETSQYPEEKKTMSDSVVVASEPGKMSLNQAHESVLGVEGPR